MNSEGFKETEIGLIPNEWEISNLGNVTKKITKGTTPTTLGKNFVDKGINFIKAESILDDGSFIEDKFTHIDQDTNELLKRSILEKNDILFSIAGVIGRTALVKSEILPANTNQAIAIIRPKPHIIIPQFLGYYLSTKRFGEVVKSRIVQTAQANVSLSVLSNSPVILPDIKEQSTITNILSCIDNKIQLNQKMNQTLDQIGQAIFRHWFVHFEFPDSEGRPYKSSGGEMVDSELGEIPLEWQITQLKDHCKAIRGFTTKYVEKSNLINLNQKVNRGTYLDKSNFKYYPKDTKVPKEKFACRKDILINSLGEGTIGRTHLYWEDSENVIIDQHMSIVRPDQENILSEYLYYHLIQPASKYRLDNEITGSTGMLMLNISKIRDFWIIVPDINIQKKFAALISVIYYKKFNLTKQSETLSQIRDSLLPKLMSGKIRVNIPEEATAK